MVSRVATVKYSEEYFQQKMIRHAEKQGNMSQPQGKKEKLIETVPEKADIGLTKTKTILTMFKELKKNMDKELKETMKMMSHQVENINKETEVVKRN